MRSQVVSGLAFFVFETLGFTWIILKIERFVLKVENRSELLLIAGDLLVT